MIQWFGVVNEKRTVPIFQWHVFNQCFFLHFLPKNKLVLSWFSFLLPNLWHTTNHREFLLNIIYTTTSHTCFIRWLTFYHWGKYTKMSSRNFSIFSFLQIAIYLELLQFFDKAFLNKNDSFCKFQCYLMNLYQIFPFDLISD